MLITGANGQLGKELVRVLSRGHSELGQIPAVYRDAAVTLTDVEQMDITDTAAVLDCFRQGGYDIVFNCAAMTDVDGCESDPETAMRINAVGARNLAAAAARFSCKMVHVSTDYVFSGNQQTPRAEWDTCDPQTVYGKSKLLGERYTAAFCPRFFIVRTAWLYGYEGKNFVKTILAAAKKDHALTVVSDQIGNPTSAADLAHHLLKLAATEEYGVYHCVGHGECSWFDFARKIIEYAGIECETSACSSEQLARPAKRPAFSTLQNLMLRCTVGDEMRPWQEALRSFMDHYCREGGL